LDALEGEGEKPDQPLNPEGKSMTNEDPGGWESKNVAADARERASDEELNELARAQSRADAVAVCWGKRVDAPIFGETSRMYRARVLRPFQKYSLEYKDVNLRDIRDKALFEAAEARIYADAEHAAKTASDLEVDEFREVKRRDKCGRTVSEFYGRSPHSWLNPNSRFRNMVVGFNKK
jgi:hypothetical protein